MKVACNSRTSWAHGQHPVYHLRSLECRTAHAKSEQNASTPKPYARPNTAVINSERPKHGPERVVEEINSDLPDADFWPGIICRLRARTTAMIVMT